MVKSILVVRKDTKQATSQGKKIEMLDKPDRLQAWVDALNETLGWKKYSVA